MTLLDLLFLLYLKLRPLLANARLPPQNVFHFLTAAEEALCPHVDYWSLNLRSLPRPSDFPCFGNHGPQSDISATPSPAFYSLALWHSTFSCPIPLQMGLTPQAAFTVSLGYMAIPAKTTE